jgi:AcrR family transcriptional regulator
VTEPAAAPAVEPDRPVRRSPFAANPAVGPRGQRTQQRILDAALEVFGELGFAECSIDAITRRAGCSRASFYQYFSSKDDVFSQLAARVARQVVALTDSIGPLTPDPAGRAALSAWLERYSEIHAANIAVFRVFDSAAESTPPVATMRATAGEHAVSRIRSKLDVGGLSARELDAVITLLVDCVRRTLRIADMLRSAAPAAYPAERVHDALTDAIHRTLFGPIPQVNDGRPGLPPPVLTISPSARRTFDRLSVTDTAARAATMQSLLDAGHDVLAVRGYHATRVDDIVQAAGLSHGAFYRYFANLAEFVEALLLRSIRPVADALERIPAADVPDARAQLRRWLRTYNSAQARETAMIRVWVDASLDSTELSADTAAAVDWARRVMAGYLQPRGFGDPDMDAVVMLALLDAFGAHRRSADVIDAVAHVVERGLLGRPA